MVLISTVGRMLSADSKHYERIGCDRYYETMCWLADPTDEYHDASTALKKIVITGNSALDDVNDEWGANNMHEAIVEEMITKLINNTLQFHE